MPLKSFIILPQELTFVCLFVFLGERFAEFGFQDVCDSCVLCALSFPFFFSLKTARVS